jgi:hypothetical protein
MKRFPLELIRKVAPHRLPGYVEAVLAAGTVDRNDVVLTDEAYEALAERFSGGRKKAESRQAGTGAELKKLLKAIGIVATPNCSCNARARTMDANGIEWCEANIDTIVGWLREEATKRKLPFVDMAGRLLVKRAIRNARKAAS